MSWRRTSESSPTDRGRAVEPHGSPHTIASLVVRSTYRLLVAIALTGVLVAVSLGGCATTDESGEPASPSSTEPSPEPLVEERAVRDSIRSGFGTIQYVNLEGGFYGLIDRDAGTRYAPGAIPDSLRIDGLRVEYEVRVRDVMTIQMWGTPVEILHLEQVD